MRTRIDCLPDGVYDDRKSALLGAYEEWWGSIDTDKMDVEMHRGPSGDYTILVHTTPLPTVPEMMLELVTEL